MKNKLSIFHTNFYQYKYTTTFDNKSVLFDFYNAGSDVSRPNTYPSFQHCNDSISVASAHRPRRRGTRNVLKRRSGFSSTIAPERFLKYFSRKKKGLPPGNKTSKLHRCRAEVVCLCIGNIGHKHKVVYLFLWLKS